MASPVLVHPTPVSNHFTHPHDYHRYERSLPSPPFHQQHPSLSRTSFAPPSPPSQHAGLDIEPSPQYSPLSSPAQSPRPPPSPPLAQSPVNDTMKRRERSQHVEKDKEKSRDSSSSKYNTSRQADVTSPAKPDPDAEPAKPMATASSSEAAPSTDSLNPSSKTVDELALSSALRLLVLQRDRAKRDVVKLAELREKAIKEPLEFVEWVSKQKRGRASSSASSSSDSSDQKPNVFNGEEIPKPQEIYKCPQIEWSQYHIVSYPLDRIHDKQVRRPSPSRPVGSSGPAGVPASMQTGGIIGRPVVEGMGFGETIAGDATAIQGGMRLFDRNMGQMGGVVGR